MAAALALGIDPRRTVHVTRGAPDRFHVYFTRPPECPIIGTVLLVPAVPKLEIKCDKGGITLPPSIHPSGDVYRWVGRLRDIGPLPAPALAALRAELRAMDAREAERLAAPTVDPSTLSPEIIDRRIMAKIAKLGAREQGTRDVTAYKLACFLVRDFALDLVTAMAYLAMWNAGNTPPLTERDLQNKLKSALKLGKRPLGSGLYRRRTLCRVRGIEPRALPAGKPARQLGGAS